MEKKTIGLFGGRGGLGEKLIPLLKDKYNVVSPSSKMVNITNFNDVKYFFESNDIDIVINLSGYNFNSFIHKLDENSISEIDKIIDVNIKGCINVVTNALIKMREQKYGRIILISSVLAEKVTLGTGLYSASKTFTDSITKMVSAENISKNITCNSLQLGYFDGGMTNKLPIKFAETIKESIGLKRFGDIVELYKTIDFLIETEYITGQNINISGGLL
jgi:NAD(P)-dependent dehydrogenase (short-subunit alcohol dehydrogenase family)